MATMAESYEVKYMYWLDYTADVVNEYCKTVMYSQHSGRIHTASIFHAKSV